LLTIVGSLLLVLAGPPPSDAVTITITFGSGSPPTNTVGGGNLQDIARAAADRWQNIIKDDFTLAVNINWAPTADSHILAATVADDTGGSPLRVTQATMTVDNSGTNVLYLDPTPADDDGFVTFDSDSANLGGGSITVGQSYESSTGDPKGAFDLLSIINHELGHALGYNRGLSTYASTVRSDRTILVDDPRPDPNTILNVKDPSVSAHLDEAAESALANALMIETMSASRRKFASAADTLGLSEVSQFSTLILP